MLDFYEREDACRCVYCMNYLPVEYKNDYFIAVRGICRKHDILRKPESPICDDFVLLSGVHTKKWYPNKEL